MANPTVLGVGIGGLMESALCEALYLAGADSERIREVARHLEGHPTDPRYASHSIAARALAIHATSSCTGRCTAFANELLEAVGNGGAGTRLMAEVKIGALHLVHGRRRQRGAAWRGAEEALRTGLALRLRPWLRLYAIHGETALSESGGASILCQLAEADPDGWRHTLVRAVSAAVGPDRVLLLATLAKVADKDTIRAMRQVSGKDVTEARRSLQNSTAARLYLRTFGGVSLHRGDWTGPALPIEKRRVRMLLAVLAARSQSTLTRDLAIDIMWPEAERDAGINNLNQTVFQLRRYIDPDYRGGDSPEYVVSSSEQISLNRLLVRTDLDEIRRLPQRLLGADWAQRNAAAIRVVELVRGEFLADLRYEEWAALQQLAVHSEVRTRLLPIATQLDAFDLDASLLAASALIGLDPYDEAAVLALAECLTRSGRRVAARDLVVEFAARIQIEMDEGPSTAVTTAAERLGGLDRINRGLTVARN